MIKQYKLINSKKRIKGIRCSVTGFKMQDELKSWIKLIIKDLEPFADTNPL